MSRRHHSGFGIIVQGIIGAAQAVALRSGEAHEYSAVKKYLKKEGHTQEREAHSALELKKRELATKEGLLRTEAETQMLADQSLKKVVIVGGVTAIALAILAFGLIIMFKSREDEYE